MTKTALTARRLSELAPKSTHKAAALPRHAQAPQRVGWLIAGLTLLVVGLVGGLGAWAYTAPMQSAVLAPGQFGVEGNRLVVQHLEGGIVETIAVKEGQEVREGDVIATLDDTRPRAALAILESQLAATLASEMRLRAEFTDADEMAPSEELSALIDRNPVLQGVLDSERDLFAADRRLLAGRIEIVLNRIAQLERQREGNQERILAQQNQLELLREDLESAQILVDKGLTTRSRVLAMRRDEAGLMGDIAIARSDLQTIERQISEQQETKLQITRDMLTTIADQRQQVNQTLNDLRQRVAAAQDVVERTTIRAPHSGTIMGLNINTLGGVLAEGQIITEILPADTSVVVDVLIDPDDIDQVRAGGEARVRLTAYNYRTTPTVMGRVVRVAPDSVANPVTGLPSYKAQVELAPGALDHLPDVSVLPGMQAQVMIATGEQTLVDYLAAPILSGLEVALSDQM